MFFLALSKPRLGVRLGSTSLLLRPVATPGNATALAVYGLHWHGRRLTLNVDNKGAATVALLAGAPLILRSEHEHSSHNKYVRLSAGGMRPIHCLPLCKRVCSIQRAWRADD